MVMITATLDKLGELVSRVNNPNHQGVFGNTLLHAVIEYENSLELVQKLINAGANVNITNFFGITPLHCAVIYRNHGAFNELLQSGAFINAKNFDGNTALHYSISNCMSSGLHQTCSHLVFNKHFPDKWLIKKLLQYETLNINAINIRGETPLMWAVAYKQLDVVKALIEKKANVNICDCLKRTPLHVALSDTKPNIDIIFELLIHGACIYCLNNKAEAPSDLLVQRMLNSQSYEFMEISAKLFAIMHEINSLTIPKLEADSHVLLLKRCSDEVQIMKNTLVSENLSLFEFLFKDMNVKGTRNTKSEAYKTAVEILLSDDISMYCDIIIKRIPKFELCRILVQLLLTKKKLGCSNKEDYLSLFSNLLVSYRLSEYLSHTDMHNIIVALLAEKKTE